MRTMLVLLMLPIAGCVGLPPSAFDVAASCSRQQMEISGGVRGTPYTYHTHANTACVDDDKHRTQASNEYRLNRGQVDQRAHYDDRDGDNRRTTQSKTWSGPRGYGTERTLVVQTKDVVWGGRFKVKVR